MVESNCEGTSIRECPTRCRFRCRCDASISWTGMGRRRSRNVSPLMSVRYCFSETARTTSMAWMNNQQCAWQGRRGDPGKVVYRSEIDLDKFQDQPLNLSLIMVYFLMPMQTSSSVAQATTTQSILTSASWVGTFSPSCSI